MMKEWIETISCNNNKQKHMSCDVKQLFEDLYDTSVKG